MKLEIPGGKLCLLRLDAVDDAQLARWETWLDPEKRARIGRQDAQHRRQTVCADALARLMLAGPGATAPQALRFACSASGRPSCPVLPLSFSLSHSGGYAACAVSARPVGVDLEATPCAWFPAEQAMTPRALRSSGRPRKPCSSAAVRRSDACAICRSR